MYTVHLFSRIELPLRLEFCRRRCCCCCCYCPSAPAAAAPAAAADAPAAPAPVVNAAALLLSLLLPPDAVPAATPQLLLQLTQMKLSKTSSPETDWQRNGSLEEDDVQSLLACP